MADNSENVRRGVLNAIYDYKNLKIVGTEIVIIAVICGIYFSSWWVFGGTLIGLILMFAIRILSFLLCAILTLAWGFIGLFIGFGFDSHPAGYVLAAIGLFFGYFVHFSIRR